MSAVITEAIKAVCQNVFWLLGINHSGSVVDFSHLIPKEQREETFTCSVITVTILSACSHDNNTDDE